MLEREDYMKTVSASETRSSALELRPTSFSTNGSPEKRAPSPSEKLESPAPKSAVKAKSSPRTTENSVPFATRAGEMPARDLEMGGAGTIPSMTANRRRSTNRADSDDEGL